LEISVISIGDQLPCPVAPDALQGIPRQQTNPSRWQGQNWDQFVAALKTDGINIDEDKGVNSIYLTDAGGLANGLPHGVLCAESSKQVASLLKRAEEFKVPVTSRGRGLTTEGESVAFGGVMLDMTGMKQVIKVDQQALTVRTQPGIFWHRLAEVLRRDGMDYLSAPLNLTSSVGGTIGVGGIDVNSCQFGCSADQVLSLEVVTPTGEIIECSDEENPELFQRVILGYGQFGVITEVTLRIRPFTPMRMHYFYYRSLRNAIEDLQLRDKHQVCHYSGILTMMDKAITLLVGFDNDEQEKIFFDQWRNKIGGFGELLFGLQLLGHYVIRPWRFRELLFLLDRKRSLFPDLQPPQHMRDGKLIDRTAVFSRAVWKHWDHKHMVIPDLATNVDKFVEAVERGNKVCKKHFKHYTLYCVGIKLRDDHKAHYELSSIPPDAEGMSYGCEFEPMLDERDYSRDELQSFKNDIYDIGVDMKTSYYRFGGMMKGYIRRALGDEVVDKHLQMKREADPAMILNRDVIF